MLGQLSIDGPSVETKHLGVVKHYANQCAEESYLERIRLVDLFEVGSSEHLSLQDRKCLELRQGLITIRVLGEFI